MAGVVEQVVGAPGALAEPIHRGLHGVGGRQVERVRGLPRLEEDVGVLGRAPEHRVLGGECPRAMRPHQPVVDQRAQVRVGERLDLRHLVRGAEPVEEVQERHPRLEGRRVGDEREILGLLHRRAAQHREPGRPRGHHVGVIAEDRERMGGHGAGRDVHHERCQLTGDLEHVRDHQQQALRGGEGRAEGARLQRAVQGARRAPFALHLHDVGHGAPQVVPAQRRPLVGQLAHRRRRGDRIDRDDLAQPVCDGRDGLVAVDRLHPAQVGMLRLYVGVHARHRGWPRGRDVGAKDPRGKGRSDRQGARRSTRQPVGCAVKRKRSCSRCRRPCQNSIVSGRTA